MWSFVFDVAFDVWQGYVLSPFCIIAIISSVPSDLGNLFDAKMDVLLSSTRYLPVEHENEELYIKYHLQTAVVEYYVSLALNDICSSHKCA